MMREKGWEKMLLAAKLLKEKGILFQLTFAGAWPSAREEKLFSELIFEYGITSYVKYIGVVAGDDKSTLLKQTDILIFPTDYKYETFGRVIIEGMAFGVPVIAHGIATIPTIIKDQETGWVLKENTPEEICHAIIKIADKDKLLSIGLKARSRFLMNYELTDFKSKFIDVIQKVS